MSQRLIFYGSLKDLDRFYEITGYKPSSVRYGFVRGDLYEVTDYTEPRGIHKYPILVPAEGTNVVISIEITLWLKPAQQKILWTKLDEFEGSLYRKQTITFYPFLGNASHGTAYIARSADLHGKMNIAKLIPVSTVYLWSS